MEVALTAAIPQAIAPLFAADRRPLPRREATTAVFYSISNCQKWLAGISFGSFLIKQVVDKLRRDLGSLSTFVTLSPVSGFARWLDRIDLLGDVSERGLREAHGLMVNYLYDLARIGENHEAYAEKRTVAASPAVKALLRREATGREVA